MINEVDKERESKQSKNNRRKSDNSIRRFSPSTTTAFIMKSAIPLFVNR